MNVRTFILFLLLSLSSAAALAVPSMVEVEKSIATEDFTKAKSQLLEVLKKYPDSYVANRYMVQVLELEYARTLKPSVERKFYESRLKEVNAKIEAEKSERYNERLQKVLITVAIVLLMIALVTVACIFGIPVLKRRKALKEEALRVEKWKAEALADLIDIDHAISSVLDDELTLDVFTKSYPASKLQLLKDLDADNKDAIRSLNENDFREGAIRQHISDGRDFLYHIGVTI